MNQSSTLRASKTTIALNKVKTFFSKPHNVTKPAGNAATCESPPALRSNRSRTQLGDQPCCA